VTQISVNFASLQDAADHLQSSHGALTGHVDEMNRLLNNLRDTWQGDTGMSWQDVQSGWNQSAGDVFTVVSELNKAVRTSLDNYWSTNRGLTSMWSG
jgi:early secretory antigenic target protein ESAT-6